MMTFLPIRKCVAEKLQGNSEKEALNWGLAYSLGEGRGSSESSLPLPPGDQTQVLRLAACALISDPSSPAQEIKYRN